MPRKDHYQATIPKNALAGMIYSSPLDFTAVYNASNSLTITFPAGATFLPADAEDILWLEIRFTNAAGQDMLLDNANYKFDYESGTGLLTVTPDPSFPATGGEFMVQLLGPPRDLDILTELALRSGFGSAGIIFSPRHFSATRYSATQLTLNGMPTVPSAIQFLSVTEKESGVLRKKWVAGKDRFEWDAANKRLTVVGATFSDSASAEWMVAYVDVLGFDTATNSWQMAQTNARERKFTEEEPLLDAQSLASIVTTSYVDVKNQVWLGLRFTYTTDDDVGTYNLYIKPMEDPTDSGTTKHEFFVGDWAYPNTPASTISVQGTRLRVQVVLAVVGAVTTYGLVFIKVPALNRVLFEFEEEKPGGAAAGVLTASTTTQN